MDLERRVSRAASCSWRSLLRVSLGERKKRIFIITKQLHDSRGGKKNDVGACVCVRNIENEKKKGGGGASLTATHKPHFI